MDPCIVIASCTTKIFPDRIIKEILNVVEELPESLDIKVEHVRSYPWHISTKYYDAEVCVCALDNKTIGSKEFAESVNAVIICFDGQSENALQPVEHWLTFTNEFDAEIKIIVCESCKNSYSTDDSNLGIKRIDAQKWCIENGFELVELEPQDNSDAEDEDDEFPEAVGVKRIIQALHAHMWPNLSMKGNSTINPISESSNSSNTNQTFPTNGTNATSSCNGTNGAESINNTVDEMSEESFEELFQNLALMKSKAEQLGGSERKAYAEKMAIAFWRSMGGNESEVAGISSSEDEGEVVNYEELN